MREDFFKEEIICGYKVTEKMKHVWGVQLDLIETFKNVCEKNNLKYYLIYGSLIGAVRHKGFIPWDDDVDIAMPREDFEKLKEIAKTGFQEPYFLQTPENEKNYFRGGLCKFRNGNTTGIDIESIGHNCNLGLWLDIHAIDNCYSDIKKRIKQQKKVNFYQQLCYAKTYGKGFKKFRNLNYFKWTFLCFISNFITHERLCDKLETSCMSCDEKNTEYVVIFSEFKYFYKQDFEFPVYLDFENLKLPAPKGYDRCLKMSMGANYMEFPPVEERKPHHIGILDPLVPYKTYNSRFKDIFNNINNKTIVLFGAGQMFDHYMKECGKKYAPEFIIDNDKTKWGTKKHGITVKSPDELFKIPKNNLRLIICNIYYNEISEQLNQMGIDEYYIYVQRKEWIN